MKQLKSRTVFVLIFEALLLLGMLFLLFSYVIDGEYWAEHRSVGSITSGCITDRNGKVLYNFENGEYNSDYLTRIATVHVVGDENGSIAYGAKKVFVNSNIEFSHIFGITEKEISDIKLTIDANLNAKAIDLLNGRKGTVGIYNYKTGDILCMVSSPTFDPMSSAEIEAINSGSEKYEGVYINRFISSTYTPGSTFKLVTSAAAIENLDMDSFSYNCSGELSYGDDSVTCPSVHGEVDFSSALAKSCNGAFATLANKIGGTTLKSYAEKAGLLQSLDISGIQTAVGNFSVSKLKIEEGWSGVGQYKDLINPACELALMGCIAGDSEAAYPKLLLSEETTVNNIGWKSNTCKKIKDLMRNNVVNHYGQDQFDDLPVCAKSGTAEVGEEDPHSWFVGFIDSDDYPYAFVVLIENGGWGSSEGGYVASELLKAACYN